MGSLDRRLRRLMRGPGGGSGGDGGLPTVHVLIRCGMTQEDLEGAIETRRRELGIPADTEFETFLVTHYEELDADTWDAMASLGREAMLQLMKCDNPACVVCHRPDSQD